MKTLYTLLKQENKNPIELIDKTFRFKDFNVARLKLDMYPELWKIENKVEYALIVDYDDGRLILNLLGVNRECLGESIFIEFSSFAPRVVPILQSLLVEASPLERLSGIILSAYQYFLLYIKQILSR